MIETLLVIIIGGFFLYVCFRAAGDRINRDFQKSIDEAAKVVDNIEAAQHRLRAEYDKAVGNMLRPSEVWECTNCQMTNEIQPGVSTCSKCGHPKTARYSVTR